MSKIGFKDLDTFLKIVIVYGFLSMIWSIIVFVAVIIIGITEASI